MKFLALTCLALLTLLALVSPVPVDRASQLLLLQPYQYQSMHYQPERFQASAQNPDNIFFDSLQQKPSSAYITQDSLVYVVPSLRDTELPAPQTGYIEGIYNWLTGPSAVPVETAPGPASPEPQVPLPESQSHSAESQPFLSPPPTQSSPLISESQTTSGEAQPIESEQETPAVEANSGSKEAEKKLPIVSAESSDFISHKVSSSKSAAAKLEQLEPEAELIPGAQPEQAQHQPAQPPQLPLLPGGPPPPYYNVQQHLFGNNPHYTPLPSYRPQPNFPGGYQRFYIVSPQPAYHAKDGGDQAIGQPGFVIQKFGVELLDGPGDDSASAKRGPDPITPFAPTFADAGAPLSVLPVYGYNQPAQHQFGQDFSLHQGPLHFSQYVNLQLRPGGGAGDVPGSEVAIGTGAREELLLLSQLRHVVPLDRTFQFKEEILNSKNEIREKNNDSENKALEKKIQGRSRQVIISKLIGGRFIGVG